MKSTSKSMPQKTKTKFKKLPIIAILVAGGRSERMLGGLPKPYREVGGMSVLRRAVKVFLTHPEIDGVRVVIRREHHYYYKKSVEGLAIIPCVIGGNSRQESVRLGLEAVAHFQPEIVLIHDVARPMVSSELISRIISATREQKAVIPVLKVADTIKRLENNKVLETLPRENLGIVQTPQGFDYETLVMAHEQGRGSEFTDDAAVCEAAEVSVFAVAGEAENFKITSEQDMKLMENLLGIAMETRVGMGYDVHRLALHNAYTPPDQQIITLFGVQIPFSHYLVGHSDADVGLHAMVDAILGAIGEGDIGVHFPPDDPKWKGANSSQFLLYAYELLKTNGGEIVNIDVTIICEKPKITPHRTNMIEHISNILKLDKMRISIKATTTETLGFTGREEGIAAQAVVMVKLPNSSA